MLVSVTVAGAVAVLVVIITGVVFVSGVAVLPCEHAPAIDNSVTMLIIGNNSLIRIIFTPSMYLFRKKYAALGPVRQVYLATISLTYYFFNCRLRKKISDYTYALVTALNDKKNIGPGFKNYAAICLRKKKISLCIGKFV